MAFTAKPNEIGYYFPIAGTKRQDKLTSLGEEAIFAGAGRDILTGLPREQESGLLTVPLLSGGSGDDRYRIIGNNGCIIADLGNRKDIDTLDASRFNPKKLTTYVVNKRDLLLTDGSKRALLIDPLGKQTKANRIERIKLSGGTLSSRAFLNSQRQNGASVATTYDALQQAGYLDFSESGLNTSFGDPFSKTLFTAPGIANNRLVA